MSRSAAGKYLLLLVMVVVLRAASAERGQSQPVSCDNVCAAEQIVIILYPELRHDAQVQLTSEFPLYSLGNITSFSMVVRTPISHDNLFKIPPDVAVDERTLNAVAPRLLTANLSYFAVGRPHNLQHIFLEGPLAHSDVIERLKAIIDSHREWSDEEVSKNLKAAGLRYSDQSAANDLKKQIPWDALEEALGTITVDSISFVSRSKGDYERHLPSAMLAWVISFRAQKLGESVRKFDLSAEPFEGKVTLIQTRDAGN